MFTKNDKQAAPVAGTTTGTTTAPKGDGFEALDLDMPAVRWEETPAIEGKVVDEDTFNSDNGPKRVLVVMIGEIPTRLIEQPGLRRLFEKVHVGDEIRVRTTGLRDLGNKQSMRTFEAQVKAAPKASSAVQDERNREQVNGRPSRRP